MPFYKVILVVEGNDPFEVDNLVEAIVDFRSSCADLWHKSTENMTDEEILEFFEKTREEMEGGNYE